MQRSLVLGGKMGKSSVKNRGRQAVRSAIEALETRRLLTAITVASTADTFDGVDMTLRQAIATAESLSGPQTINFDPTVFATPQTITLTQGQLDLSDTNLLTIQGPAVGVTISGNNTSRVLTVDDGASGELDNVTLTGGNGSIGGAVHNSGTLTMVDSTISGNSANFEGGAFYNSTDGTLTLTGCTVSGNSAGSAGGLFSYGGLTLNNVTISGNSALNGAAGLAEVFGSATLNDVTISDNTGLNAASFPQGMATINNSIIAGNSTTTEVNVSYSGTNNFIGGNPVLAPLGNYGGLTQTMPPLPGSPVISAGSSSLIPNGITTDQRGQPRTLNGAVDIGAVQTGGFIITPVSADQTQSALAGSAFANPLGVTVTSVNAIDPVAGGLIAYTLNPAAGGATATLSGTTATIAADGTAGAAITASANSTLGTYTVSVSTAGVATPATFTLNNLETPSLTVTTTQDVVDPTDGLTSLREAIAYAETLTGAQTVSFASNVTGTVTLNGSELLINDSSGKITIDGPGAQTLAISGAGLSRVFEISAGTTAEIDNLTITDGNAGAGIRTGGGVYNAGNLTVAASTVSGNTSGFTGGAFYNSPRGTLTVDDSTISGNSSQYCAGVQNWGTLNLTNVTISGNSSSTGDIGGLDHVFGLLTMNDCTFSNNSGLTTISLASTATMNNTIVAGDSSSYEVHGLSYSGTNNFIGGNPLLAPLGNYGGPTQTMPPLPGSPVIGTGSTSVIPSGVTTDPRGQPRTVNGAADIGAVQSQGYTLNIVSGNNQTVLAGSSFNSPLSVTVTPNDASDPVIGGVVTFAGPSTGASISQPVSATIAPYSGTTGSATATVTANNVEGTYTVTASATGASSFAFPSLTNVLQPAFSGLTSQSIAYGTSSIALGGTLAAGATAAIGNVTVAISGNGSPGLTQTVAVGADGTFAANFNIAGLSPNPSLPYNVSYTFAAQNYFLSTSNTSTTLTITASLTVNTTGDPASSPGAQTSLREAIAYAEFLGGAQTITFASNVTGTITLGGTALTLNDPTGKITIQGPGSSTLAISGGQSSGVFVVNSGTSAEIDGLTITDGTIAGAGGGIYSLGSLSLNNDAVTNNSAGSAAGVFASGLLLVNNSVFSGNSCPSNDGGAIQIYNNPSANQNQINNSTINGNTASQGGGVWSNGTLSLTNDTVSGNSASNSGAGVDSSGNTTISGSLITGNTGSEFGGAIEQLGGSLTVSGSTFTLNSSYEGGGLFDQSGSAQIVNSTFTSNSGTFGAAVFIALTTQASLISDTIANNSASAVGAVRSDFNSSTLLYNTIIASNNHGDISTGDGGVISASSANNLIDDANTSGGLPSGVNGNIIGKSAMLAPLGNYGGPTQTMPPLPGSPVIGAGSTSLIPNGITTDQRGEPRTVNGAVDIGAVQTQGYSLSIGPGDDQSALVGTTFATGLGVFLVPDYPRDPIIGGIVTFTGPSSGAGITGAPTANIQQHDGFAFTVVTANSTLGSYTVSASTTGASSIVFHLSNDEAPSLTVTTTSDVVDPTDGLTSLREAIAYAQTLTGSQTINFDSTVFATPQTITLDANLGQLVLSDANLVTIQGPAAGVTIDANNASGVFQVNGGAQAAFNDLTIANGQAVNGGGIYNSGKLTLSDSTISGNSGNLGGGIYNSGTLTIVDSTVSGNSANGGGAIFNGTGTLTITNSTLSNDSGRIGGAIFNESDTLTITDSTLSNNSAGSGADFYSDIAPTTYNSILTDSIFGGLSGSNNLLGTVTAQGLQASVGTVESSLAAFGLGTLGNYGGTTQTIPLLPGSPAIGAGATADIPANVTTDQRGQARTYNGAVDIGAFQTQGYTIAGTNTQSTPNGTAFPSPLHVTVTANLAGDPVAGGVVTYTVNPAANGASATLSSSTATIGADGTAGGSVIATANSDPGSYTVSATAAGVTTPATFTLTNDETPSLTVTTTSDVVDPTDGLTSLREAIAYAQTLTGSQTINFDSTVFATPQTITLTNGQLVLSDSDLVTIQGPAAGVTIDANHASRLFQVDGGAQAAFNDLTLINGNSFSGGIYNFGKLTLSDSTISGNSGIDGGGIYNSGRLTIVDSTVSGNYAIDDGGAIFNIGTGTLTITNSTLSNDSSTNDGGAIYNNNNSSSTGRLTITNSTLSNDSGSIGGAIFNNSNTLTITNSTLYNDSGTNGGGAIYNNSNTLTITDSTLSNNSAGSGADFYSDIAPTTYNSILTDSIVGGLSGSNNLLGTVTAQGLPASVGTVEPSLAAFGLGTLGNYGGTTQTIPLLPGSPAIGAGATADIPANVTTDQRGQARTYNGAVDIGAFQTQGYTIAGTNTQSTPNGTAFPSPLHVTVTANLAGDPVAGGVVTYTVNAAANGAAATLSGSTDTIQSDGTAGSAITATANSDLGTYTVSATAAGVATPATFTLTNDETPSLVVTTTSDVVDPTDGLTSLREAIAYAETLSGPQTIDFDPTVFATPQTITLDANLGQLVLSDADLVTIQGPAAGVTIDANHASRLFQVNGGAQAAFNDLTLINGNSDSGGGIYSSGSLTLSDDTISGNTATGNGEGGGGVYNFGGTLMVNNCTFGNDQGYVGGGILNYGTATVTDTTFVDDDGGNGGGLENYNGSCAVNNSTFNGCTSYDGGGIFSYATLTLTNTIVANSSGGDLDLEGSSSGSNDLIGDGSSLSSFSNSLQGDPLLAPLGNYGGLTETMPPLPGSPAIGAGDVTLIPSGVTTDQRGQPRTLNGAVDIGAVQTQGYTVAAATGDGTQSAIVSNIFANPLGVTVTAVNGVDPVAGGTITYTVNAAADGAAATLSGSTDTIQSDGTAGAAITATANSDLGSYTVSATAAGVTTPATFTLTNDEIPSLIVTTTQDVVDPADGLTSLREALAYAQTLTGPQTVTFDPTVFATRQTITLTLGALQLSDSSLITVDGPSAGVTISGGQATQVFDVDGGANAKLEGLTLTQGLGGAVINNGTLTIIDTTLSGNQSSDDGGGLSNYGTLTIDDSSISGNAAHTGGGIYNDGTLTLTNSTISGNTVQTSGGGWNQNYNTGDGNGGLPNPTAALATVHALTAESSAADGGGGIANYGTLNLYDSTITNNSSQGDGGGITNQGTLTIANTIVAGNTAATGSEISSTPAVTSGGHNLIGQSGETAASALEGFTTTTGDILATSDGTAPSALSAILAAALASNGGPTDTFALAARSPAINAGSNALIPAGVTTDQRGVGYPRISAGTVDIGAYEVQVATPTITDLAVPTAATVGTSIADKATVTGGNNPTGTVTFNLYNNPNGAGTPLFSETNVPLSGGVAESGAYTAVAVGTDYWVATYSGDNANTSASTTASGTPVTISKAPTHFVSALGTTINYGTATALLTGKVGATGVTPAGSVSITINGTTVSTPLLSDGSFSCAFPTATMPAGSYQIVFSYGGNSNFIGSTLTTSSKALVINKRSTAFASITGSTITYGAATVAINGKMSASGVTVPDGTVAITINNITVNATVKSDGSFSYAFPTTGLSAGMYPISFAYSGDSNFLASTLMTSNAAIVILKRATAFSSATSTTINYATATVSLSGAIGASGVIPSDGTVSITVNGNTINVPLQSNGTFSTPFPSASIPAGTYTIGYAYSGDGNLIGSTISRTLVVNKRSTGFLNAVGSTITYGASSVPISGKVGGGGVTVPDGTVAITVNSTTVNASVQPDGSFSYAFPTTGLSAGSYQITFTYSGDSNFLGNTLITSNAAIVINKRPAGFASASSATITHGTATASLTGKVSASGLIPTGTVSITINNVVVIVSLQPDGSFSDAYATSTLAPGSYVITYTYSGDANFLSATIAKTLIVK